jgi:hypothetical protein
LYKDVKYTDIITDNFLNCYIKQEKELIINTKASIEAFFISKSHYNDFNLFIGGKYSEFSFKLKKNILDFWCLTNESNLFSVLFKTNKIIEKYWVEKFGNKVYKWSPYAERWPKPNLILELYNPNLN